MSLRVGVSSSLSSLGFFSSSRLILKVYSFSSLTTFFFSLQHALAGERAVSSTSWLEPRKSCVLGLPFYLTLRRSHLLSRLENSDRVHEVPKSELSLLFLVLDDNNKLFLFFYNTLHFVRALALAVGSFRC